METKRKSSAIWIKIFSLISAIALVGMGVLFYSSVEEKITIWGDAIELLTNPTSVDFGHLLYIAAATCTAGLFLLGTIITLFIKSKKTVLKLYRIYSGVCGLFALLALLIECLVLTASASFWKEFATSFSAIVFLIVWVNILVGCVVRDYRKNAVIGAIKALLLLLGAGSLIALAAPLFEGSDLAAKAALDRLKYSLFPVGGNTNFFQELLSGWAKNEVFGAIAPTFYTVAIAIPLCNLILTQVTVFSQKTRAFDMVRYTIAFVVICFAFSAPVVLFRNVKTDLSLYYIVTALSLILGLVLSAFINPQTERKTVWKETAVVGTPVNEDVDESECDAPNVVKLSQEDFEIGKQISMDQEEVGNETIKTTFVSEGIDVTDYKATEFSTMPAVESDAFIASLTTAERVEFRKYFIDMDAPESDRLPRYFVGGDNRLFFKRVFVFIAQFRSLISPSLIEKIYMQAVDLMD